MESYKTLTEEEEQKRRPGPRTTSRTHEQIYRCSPNCIGNHFKHQWFDHTDHKSGSNSKSQTCVVYETPPSLQRERYICIESKGMETDTAGRPPSEELEQRRRLQGEQTLNKECRQEERGQHGTVAGSRPLDGSLCCVHAPQRRVHLHETQLTEPRGERRAHQQVCLGSGRPSRRGIRKRTEPGSAIGASGRTGVTDDSVQQQQDTHSQAHGERPPRRTTF